MEAILMRAGSFMAVIILGYVLKKVGFFKEEDFYVMSTTLIISKKPGNTGISRDIRTEFTTDLLLSD